MRYLIGGLPEQAPPPQRLALLWCEAVQCGHDISPAFACREHQQRISLLCDSGWFSHFCQFEGDLRPALDAPKVHGELITCDPQRPGGEPQFILSTYCA